MLAVEGEAGFSNLDGEHRPVRMRLAIVDWAAGHHDEIGLRLGFVIERYGQLNSDEPPRRQDGPHGIVDRADRRGMIGAVRLGDDELTSDELERLTLEHAEVDQSVVLHSGPVPERQRCLLHGFNLARSVESINAECQRHCVKMRSALNRASTSIRRGIIPT